MEHKDGILGADVYNAAPVVLGQNTFTDGFEMSKAGVKMGMTGYEAEKLVLDYRNNPSPDRITDDGNNYGLKAIGIFFGVTLTISAVATVVSWLPPMPSPIELAERYFKDTKASHRRERFSDFSQKSGWPLAVQQASAQYQGSSLVTLVAQIPKNLDSVPTKKRDALAAEVWFKLAEQGSNANSKLVSIQAEAGAWTYHATAQLVVTFLEKKCASGIEVACLDLAKVYAGAVFLSAGTDEEGEYLDKRALEFLPTTGPLSRAKAIIELRARLTNA